MIDEIVGRGTTKGEKITGDQTTIGQYLSRRRRRNIALQVEILAATPHGDDQRNQVGDPGPSFPEMKRPIAQEGGGKRHETDDDNADVHADIIRTQGRNGLATHNGRH